MMSEVISHLPSAAAAIELFHFHHLPIGIVLASLAEFSLFGGEFPYDFVGADSAGWGDLIGAARVGAGRARRA